MIPTDAILARAQATVDNARRAGYHDPGIAALRRAVRRARFRPVWWRYRLEGWRDRQRSRWVPVLKRLWRRTGRPLPAPRVQPLTIDD